MTSCRWLETRWKGWQTPRPSSFFCHLQLGSSSCGLAGLAKPHLLSEDEDGMKLLSLKKKTRSFFDKLEVIFGLGEGGVAPPQEGEFAPAPRARPKDETRSG
ncbi:hypothetical protein AMTR_s00125p00072870 [Amborella trichopoda]|uniref:Uncharacterized protein n=1 Tax=Amborella trichopoda TaxID=13333 RepID=W1NRW9_AMBTC|nr:hypothetical protein AMTR_s00125p00072870 [Amborella trichopoda]